MTWRCASSLATVLLLVTIGLGGAAVQAAPSSQQTSFSWSTPTDATGPLAIQATFDLGDNENCTVEVAAAGTFDDGPVNGFVEIQSDIGTSWVALSSGDIVQVHAGDLIDTRSDSGGGHWAAGSTLQGDLSGEVTVLVYNSDMEIWDQDIADAPIEIDVTCDDGFEVTSKAGGDDLASFNQHSLEGGVGASVAFPVDVAANAGDGMATNLTGDRGLFKLRGFQIDGTAVTDLKLDHPNGSSSWTFVGEPPEVDLTGDPGHYAVTLDRVGAARADPFFGLLVGVEDVQDLDEVL